MKAGAARALTRAHPHPRLGPYHPTVSRSGGVISGSLVKPQHVTPSALLTSAQAFDPLRLLFARDEVGAAEQLLAARIVVVDDDEFTRRAVKCALRKAHRKPICVSDADRALEQASKKRFDALLLDIEMPETDGLELCTRLRRLPQYRHTPIIFLKLHKSFEQRAESVLHGGDDFIAKPFLYSELTVKVLSHVLPVPHKPDPVGHEPAERVTDSGMFSRRELNRLRHALLNSLDGQGVSRLHERNQAGLFMSLEGEIYQPLTGLPASFLGDRGSRRAVSAAARRKQQFGQFGS